RAPRLPVPATSFCVSPGPGPPFLPRPTTPPSAGVPPACIVAWVRCAGGCWATAATVATPTPAATRAAGVNFQGPTPNFQVESMSPARERGTWELEVGNWKLSRTPNFQVERMSPARERDAWELEAGSWEFTRLIGLLRIRVRRRRPTARRCASSARGDRAA